jgi:hypothetical protein
MIDLETVAIVLDRRNPQTAAGQLCDKFLDQGRLSRIGFADYGNNGYHGNDHSPSHADWP